MPDITLKDNPPAISEVSFPPLAAHGPLVYFQYAPAERQLSVSPNYAAVLGGSPAAASAELPGWLERLHPDDRALLGQATRELLATPPGPGRELILRLVAPAEAPPRWLRLWLLAAPGPAAPEDPAAETGLAGFVEDVTLVQATLDHAQRYQAKKNAVLEILSHDLAQPMALAVQLSDYLTERLADLQDPQLDRALEDLRATCTHGMTLIHDFVDQEFLESSQVQLNLERVDLARRLRETLDTYRHNPAATQHQVTFECSHPAIYARVDDNKLLQVVNNLVGNALKFTPDGGHIWVRLSQQAQGGVRLEVQDDGVGIPAAELPHLFERFTSARRPGLRGEKTTGLGLSIAHTIVGLHRGRIWCESQEGRGTTFCVELPGAAV